MTEIIIKPCKICGSRDEELEPKVIHALFTFNPITGHIRKPYKYHSAVIDLCSICQGRYFSGECIVASGFAPSYYFGPVVEH